MLDVTVIIPLKKLGKIEEKYLNRAIGSLSDNKELNLMFVGNDAPPKPTRPLSLMALMNSGRSFASGTLIPS